MEYESIAFGFYTSKCRKVKNVRSINIRNIIKNTLIKPINFIFRMAPKYEICAGLDKGHKTTKNELKKRPGKNKVSYILVIYSI